MQFVQGCHFQGERSQGLELSIQRQRRVFISAWGIAPGLAAISLGSRQKIAGMTSGEFCPIPTSRETPYRSPLPFPSGGAP